MRRAGTGLQLIVLSLGPAPPGLAWMALCQCPAAPACCSWGEGLGTGEGALVAALGFRLQALSWDPLSLLPLGDSSCPCHSSEGDPLGTWTSGQLSGSIHLLSCSSHSSLPVYLGPPLAPSLSLQPHPVCTPPTSALWGGWGSRVGPASLTLMWSWTNSWFSIVLSVNWVQSGFSCRQTGYYTGQL